MFYAVSCGEALHVIPASGHEITDADELTVHGKEDHNYGAQDWDVIMWADSKETLYDMVGRTRVAKRLQE